MTGEAFQPTPDPRTASIQVPLPLLGLLNGVRGSVPWLVHHGRIAGPVGNDGRGSRRPVQPEGTPSGGAAGVAGAWPATLPGRGCPFGAPTARWSRRASNGRWSPTRWNKHTLAAVALGVSARRYADTLDPSSAEVPGVEQRGVAAVRGAVRQAAAVAAVVSEPAVRRAGPPGGLHRRQRFSSSTAWWSRWGSQGCKRVLGLREGATETAAVAIGLLSELVTRIREGKRARSRRQGREPRETGAQRSDAP